LPTPVSVPVMKNPGTTFIRLACESRPG
jgi:hypothetical protein